MLTVFESSTTLYPRLDNNIYQTATDLLRQEIQNHPEYKNHHWELRVEEFANGTAYARITVKDRQAMGGQVMLFFIMAIIALAWFYFGG